MRRRVRWIVLLLAAAAALPFLVARFRTPSNDRDWTPSHRLAPRVAIRGDLVEIRDVREFAYRSESDFDARYATRVYDLRYRLAYEQGLIDTDLPFDQVEKAFRIDAAAQGHGLRPGFSKAIRQALP